MKTRVLIVDDEEQFIEPLAERLLATLGQAGLEARLKATLETLRQAGVRQPGQPRPARAAAATSSRRRG